MEEGKILVEAFRKNKVRAIFDFENLLAVWGIYKDSTDFASIANDPDIQELKNLMDNIQMVYDDNKK